MGSAQSSASDVTAELPGNTGGRHRRARVERAVTDWVDQLIDLTGRNQLLYYRTLPRGTLELTDAEPAVLSALLSGSTVRLSQLFAEREHANGDDGVEPETSREPATGRTDDAFPRARTIHAKALALFEEKGIQTLFVAYGMATWTTTTSAATPSAPVLLRPLALRPRGAAETDFDVSLHGDWEVNETLLHLLRTDFRATVDVDDLHLLFQTEPAAGIDAAQVFLQLSKQVDHVPDFAIDERIVCGTFAYTKLPMVRDLRNNVDRLVAHDLIAAIAGAPDAQQVLRDLAAREVDPSLPDRTSPDDEFLILDADASQNAAVNAAVAGQPLIVQGPPGTGKSQTIANLIATLTARGQRVLFVAEKRAAIEAVTRRLDQAGLADLVMDLHGGVTSKKKLAENLARTLEQMGSTPAVDAAYVHHRLTSSRDALAGHATAMHEVREPWGVSVFEINQRLLALDDAPAGGLRFAGSRLRDLDGETVRSLRDELVEWARLSESVRSRTSPWSGAVVETDRDAQELLDLLDELAADTVPAARALLDAVLSDTGLPSPDSTEDWERALALLEALAGTLAQVRSEVFDDGLEHMAAALAPAGGGWWRRTTAALFDRDHRQAKQAARALWTGQGTPDGARLSAVIDAAHDQARQWRAIGGQGAPRLPAGLHDAVTAYRDLMDKLATLSAYLVTDDLRQRRHGDLDTEVATLLEDQQTLFRLPRILELEDRFARCHLQRLMQAVHDGQIEIDQMVDVFDRAWLSSIRAQVGAQDPRIANFDGALHDSHVEQFTNADRGHIDLTAQRVRRAVAEHATAVRDRHGDQNNLVAAQARRKRGHMPLRALFEKAPDVLTALRPCWTMSPLVVSQTLPAAQVFDVVIFDEASQVQPADAISALLRAPQAVVAGDRRQLPPTTFFDASVDADDQDPDDDGAGLTTGFESVLDVLDPLLRSYRLTWHYRSQDEKLIAFSNHTIYDGSLITFPGAHSEGCLSYEPIAHHPGRVTDTRSNDDEVARVVDLMVAHARQRRHETLGVIAMGQHHAERIERTLRERIATERDPALDTFFDEAVAERAFVKNLERVQGDERDAIILSVGYGRQPDGRLLYRFGPLNNEGGQRRLNVAVTRARRRLTLVSSFSHTDMDPSRSAAEGVALLRRYLQYVESGGAGLADADVVQPLSPFELDVKRRLEDAGLPVVAQHGSSGLRIGFALPHPTRTGRMALAVETDGAGYRASPTTRDRDRLRQQVLERLGWRFHRIWSTDWCNDPRHQTARIVSAYRHACEEIDRGWDDAAPVMTGRIDPEPPEPAPQPRDPRPAVPPGLAITDYSLGELIQIARWIRSDTLLRTEEQMLAEMMRELGFNRRGSRIVGELRRAIARA